MFYRILKILFLFFLFSCVAKTPDNEIISSSQTSFFLNKGFTLVYDNVLYENKIVKRKIDDRSLIIFQKNLKKDTYVKITNLINTKSLIAKVGNNVDYPSFYNSVISRRISDELEINLDEPYVEIKEILATSSFIAKKVKIFDEEKKVADKAPVENIEIKNLSETADVDIKIKKRKFSYTIKIADFYFKKTANEMKVRILEETSIKNLKIDKISNTKFRVYIGPFKTLDSLKKAYKDIDLLNFENIEIVKK
tara:strand:+ start:1053 stop:1805 length:753 start_codon:yes stop_codon:yes gene_type:complete